jgi:hypothetical protein
LTRITITKNEFGKIDGWRDQDKRAWNKLRGILANMEFGELITMETWFPRSPRFHKMHMGTMQRLFDNQEVFTDFEAFRDWVKIGAGFCAFNDYQGQMVAVPKSIAWHELDDEHFADVHRQFMDFLSSLYARRYLWAHLSDDLTAHMVEAVERGEY